MTIEQALEMIEVFYVHKHLHDRIRRKHDDE